MAQVFYVSCPECRGKFPCHPELWQVEYQLLCPFCGTYFPQEESPQIITGAGEHRPGRAWAARAGRAPASAAPVTPASAAPAPVPPSGVDPEGFGGSM